MLPEQGDPFSTLFKSYPVLVKSAHPLIPWSAEELGEQILSISKIETTFTSFLSEYCTLMAKKPEISALIVGIINRSSQLVSEGLRALENKISHLSTRELSETFQEISLRACREHFRNKLSEVYSLITEMYLENAVLSKEKEEQIAIDLYNLLEIFYFLKGDPATSSARFELIGSEILCKILKNETIELSEIQDLLVLEDGFEKHVDNLVLKKCKPFTGKRFFFKTKFQQIQNEHESKIEGNLPIFLQSLFCKERHRLNKLAISKLQTHLNKEFEPTFSETFTEISQKVEELKSKFHTIKNNELYIDIIKGSFIEKYTMELYKIENLYYLSQMEKYLQEIFEFMEEMLNVQENIIETRRNLKKNICNRIQDIIEKIGNPEVFSEHTHLRDLIDRKFESLQNNLLTPEDPETLLSKPQPQKAEQEKHKKLKEERKIQEEEKEKQREIIRQKLEEEKKEKERVKEMEIKRRKEREEEIRKQREEERQRQKEEQMQRQKEKEEEIRRQREEQIQKQKEKEEEIKRHKEEEIRKHKEKEEELRRQREEEKNRREEQERIKKEQKERKIAEEKRKLEEQKRQKEEEEKLRREQEKRLKEEEQFRQKEEQERLRKEEEEKLRKEEEQRLKREEEEKKIREEEESKKKEEEERKKEEEERKKQEEEKRKEKEEEERKEKEEEELRRREEEKRIQEEKIKQEKEEQERQRKIEEELEKKKVEEERKRLQEQEEEERRIMEERQRKEEEEKKEREEKERKEQEERRLREEEERIKREEEERLRKEEEERRKREEEERKQQQERERIEKERKLQEEIERKEREEKEKREREEKERRQKEEEEEIKRKQEEERKNEEERKAKENIKKPEEKKKSAINYSEFDFDDIEDDLEDDIRKPTTKAKLEQKKEEKKEPVKNDDDDQYLQEYDDDFDEFTPEEEEPQEESGKEIEVAQKRLIETENLKALNEYIRGTSYARKNKPNLENFNNIQQYIYIFEEWIQNKKMFIYEPSLAKAVVDFSIELQNQEVNEEDLQVTLETIKEEVEIFHEKQTESKDINPKTKLIFPFSFENDLGVCVIEILLEKRHVHVVFSEKLEESEQIEEKFSTLIEAFMHLYDFEEPEITQSVLPEESKAVLEVYKNELPNLLILFARHYEQSLKENEPIIINQYTIERFFYASNVLAPLYEAMCSEEEELSSFFAQLSEKFVSDNKIRISFVNVQTNDDNYQEMLGKESQKIKDDFLSSDVANWLVVFQVEIIDEENEESESVNIYMCLCRENDKKALNYLIVSKNDEDLRIQSEILQLVSSDLDNKFELTIYTDFTRHNGLSSYAQWALPLWGHVIQKRKMSALQAFRALTMAMSPFYIAYKQMD